MLSSCGKTTLLKTLFVDVQLQEREENDDVFVLVINTRKRT
jgi:hypothetical protein